MTTQLAPTDPRTHFAHATVTALGVIDGITPDQLTLSTPCPDLDVRSMLGHMLTVFRRVEALGNGTDPMAMPEFVTGVDDTGWPAAFRAAAHAVQDAWSDPAKLEVMMELPWATAPGAAMLAMYTSELTVHTWDLAVATGRPASWDESAIQVALDSARVALPSGDREAYFAQMAADPRFSPELATRPPFRNAVPVADDAPLLDQLIGWYGRQVTRAA